MRTCVIALKFHQRIETMLYSLYTKFELNQAGIECVTCVGSDLVLPHDYQMKQTLCSSILLNTYSMAFKLHRRMIDVYYKHTAEFKVHSMNTDSARSI